MSEPHILRGLEAYNAFSRFLSSKDSQSLRWLMFAQTSLVDEMDAALYKRGVADDVDAVLSQGSGLEYWANTMQRMARVLNWPGWELK